MFDKNKFESYICNMYWKRSLKSTFESVRKFFPAILITGPRQSGKTTFLINELKEKYAYVSFDDPLQRQFAQSDPNGFLNQFEEKPVILDEIQYVPELFSYIKMRIDNNRDRTGWFILTGSQQFQLMKNISDSLAGRICLLELLPFSRSEHRKPSGKTIIELIWNGGYPSIAIQPAQRDFWLQSYIQTYIERDVRQIQQIKDLRLFETFLGLYAANHGQVVNHASISRQCGISQPACKEWQSILEASYIIHLVPPYFTNFGKRLIKSPKMYFLDSAIAAYLTRQPDPHALWAGTTGGRFFEGWVVTEAVKTFASLGKRPELYFWRTNDGLEIDLILHAQGKIFPIEIKKTATPTPKHAEPLVKLKKIIPEHQIGELLIVCDVKSQQMLPHNVKAIPWNSFQTWLKSIIS